MVTHGSSWVNEAKYWYVSNLRLWTSRFILEYAFTEFVQFKIKCCMNLTSKMVPKDKYYLTNRFQVAVHLFSVTDALTTF